MNFSNALRILGKTLYTRIFLERKESYLIEEVWSKKGPGNRIPGVQMNWRRLDGRYRCRQKLPIWTYQHLRVDHKIAPLWDEVNSLFGHTLPRLWMTLAKIKLWWWILLSRWNVLRESTSTDAFTVWWEMRADVKSPPTIFITAAECSGYERWSICPHTTSNSSSAFFSDKNENLRTSFASCNFIWIWWRILPNLLIFTIP